MIAEVGQTSNPSSGLSGPVAGAPYGLASASPGINDDTVRVDTFDLDGAPANEPFHLAVFC